MPVIETMDEISSLLLIFALIILNGTFVAAEFSVARLRKTQIDHIAEEEPTSSNKSRIRTARSLQKILNNLNDYISACQFGITIASLVLGAVAEAQLEELISPYVDLLFESVTILSQGPLSATLTSHGIAITLALTIVTFFHVILGEIVPKNIALVNSEKVAFQLAGFLRILYSIFKAPVYVLNACSDICLRVIGIDSNDTSPMHTEAELKMILSTSQAEGILEEEEEQLMQNVFEFNDTIAKDIMTPRTDMICLPEDMRIKDALAEINATSHSRFPIFKNKLDNITGYISIKDILSCVEDGNIARPLKDIQSEALKITDGIFVIDLMKSMQQKKKQLAILIDEFGGTSGLVTIEDIVEEIFGEIEDEHEIPKIQILELGDGSYIVDGLVPLKDLNDELGSNFTSDHYETIGGYTYGLIGAEPKIGDKVEDNGYTISVEKHANHRIRQLKLSQA